MNKALILSVICRTLGFLGVIVASVFLVCYFNNPKYLWLLCLLLLTHIPVYEIKNHDD